MTAPTPGRVLTPSGPAAGWVRLAGNAVAEVGTGPAPAAAAVVAPPPGGWVLPGLVDIHCHGGGGFAFDAGPDDARRAAAHHQARGVSTVLASLVSNPHAVLLRQVHELADLVEEGVLAGVHLEGPYLSERRRGAHVAAHLRDPDPAEITELLDAGRGSVRMLTLAPERPGALDAIDLLVRRGVRVAVGHTDATAAQTRAAFDRGASVATHLFNGMRGLHHREGGPLLAVAERPDVWAELIADGHHVAPDVLRATLAALAGRAVLVSDAVAAAGQPDGRYHVGEQRVQLADGQMRTADGTSLAGSALSLLDAVRLVTRLGVPLPDAVAAATRAPAAALDLRGVGQIVAGASADLVVLDAELAVTAVWRAGVRA